MSFCKEIKRLRQKCILSQDDFARQLGVSFATVNRWESGKTKPTYKAMNNIKDFCISNNISFDDIEAAWLRLSDKADRRK